MPYTLYPTPYTLYPTPYTLHPTLYTLHPIPYTLHPTPYTLHPTPCTLQPSLSILTSESSTPRPAPSPQGAGALHLASEHGAVDALEALLARGARPTCRDSELASPNPLNPKQQTPDLKPMTPTPNLESEIQNPKP